MRGKTILMVLVLLSLIPITASCGAGREDGAGEGGDPRMEEARKEAWKAIEEAEVLLQGAKPGTDLSDARELLDQARDLYGRAATPEQLTGEDGSVLELVEEAKRSAREAMQSRSGQ